MTLEELQKRVQILQDIEDIKKMHRRYIQCLSSYQWEEMVKFFSRDAVVKIARDEAHNGKEGVGELIKNVIGKRVSPMRPKGGHLLIQPIIQVEGDTARGQWLLNRYVAQDTAKRHWFLVNQYYPYPQTIPAPSPECSMGRYEAEYVREDGEWKFRNLVWTMPWPEPQSKPVSQG
jgi:hypothetical protein